MFENIGVMIVFFFLLAFGMNFYFSVQESSLKKDFGKFEQMRAVQIAVQSQFMPELDCSYAGDITQKCIDLQKALAVAGTTPERFTQTFGFANVTLRWYEPSTQQSSNEPWKNVTLYGNQKKDGEGKEWSYQYFELPLVVCDQNCDPSKGRHYSFAVLQVKAYD